LLFRTGHTANWLERTTSRFARCSDNFDRGTAMTVLALQRRLKSLGFDLPKFGADGDFGDETQTAIHKALDELERLRKGTPSTPTPGRMPSSSPVWTQPKASRRIEEVIVHCTATPEGREVSVDTIRGWHKARGWKDIGYHYIVHLDGKVEAGRPEATVGSHVSGHNTGTLGVVYVGGVAKDGKTAKDTRTPAQKVALEATVKALITKYPTIKKVTGHNQYAAKACPSFDVREDPLSKLVCNRARRQFQKDRDNDQALSSSG
jgi:N-acetylmuramoyl-L-alanine amidase